VPIGRWGQPEDVAATVAFLAGEEGGYFVGQIVSPNGGTVI
jgi:3-oxoacyl-[acyl-carrier protein] reductase